VSTINLEPNIDRPDDLYAEIVGMTAGLSDAQAFAVQARLILLLANQIGDLDIIAQLVCLAAQSDGQGHETIHSENS
jgi:Protein of unknown function (DUF2783)